MFHRETYEILLTKKQCKRTTKKERSLGVKFDIISVILVLNVLYDLRMEIHVFTDIHELPGNIFTGKIGLSDFKYELRSLHLFSVTH